jgi:hypothetical protein
MHNVDSFFMSFFIVDLFVSGITCDQAKKCYAVNMSSDAASSCIGAVLSEMGPKE